MTMISTKNGWPAGLKKCIQDTRTHVAFRWCIVDNSRSMLSRDGTKLVCKEHGIYAQEACTRWEETTACVRSIVHLAIETNSPTELRFLNNADPLVVGQTATDRESSLAAALALLDTKPNGLTPICAHLCEVAEQLRALAPVLRNNDKIALLIIMTDGESTDGDIIEILKPLENLPLQVIVRVCTREQEVIEYWQNINAQLDLEIHVLQDLTTEATAVHENNPWLAYNETLQRTREYGILLPEIDSLTGRQLTKGEIRSLAMMLLPEEDVGGLLAMNVGLGDWDSFLSAVAQSQEGRPMEYCAYR